MLAQHNLSYNHAVLNSSTLERLTQSYHEHAAAGWRCVDIALPGNDVQQSPVYSRADLSKLYVMLEAINRPAQDESDLAETRERAEHAAQPPAEKQPQPDQQARREKPAPLPVSLPLEAVLRLNRSFVLLGEPGAGKSTTLQMIGLSCAVPSLALVKLPPGTVAVILPLRSNAAQIARSDGVFASIVTSVSANLTGSDKSCAEQLVGAWISANRLLVMLDGLDEILPEYAAGVRAEIEQFLRANGSGARVIVTSRPAGYAGRPIDGLSGGEFMLRPIHGRDQTVAFLCNWIEVFAACAKPGENAPLPFLSTRQAAASLYQQMATHSSLRRLTDNPLILRLSAEVYFSTRQVASSRSQLYQLFLEGEAYERARARGVTVPKETLLDALEEAGWQMMNGIPLDRAARNGRLENQSQNLLEAGRQMGVLVRQGDRMIFSHYTFLEYFAARRLARLWRENSRSAWAFLRLRLHLPDWQEPLLLLAGLLDKEEKPGERSTRNRRAPAPAADLIRRVLAARSPYEQSLRRDLQLAARLLGERRLRDPMLEQAVIGKIARLYEGTQIIPAWFYLALAALAGCLVSAALTAAVLLAAPGLGRWPLAFGAALFAAWCAWLIFFAGPPAWDRFKLLLKYLRRPILPPPNTLLALVQAAGRSGEAGLPFLAAVLADAHQEVMAHENISEPGSAAEEAILQYGSPASYQALLHSSDPYVRRAAGHGLAAADPARAVRFARLLLAQPNPDKDLAVEILEHAGGSEAVESLASLLYASELDRQVLSALAKIGSRQAITHLRRWLGVNPAQVEKLDAYTLGDLAKASVPEAEEELRRRLRSSDRDMIRSAALHVATSLDRQMFYDDLFAYINNNFRYIHAAEIAALAAIGPAARPFTDDLLRLLDDPLLSENAFWALLVINPQSVVPMIRRICAGEIALRTYSGLFDGMTTPQLQDEFIQMVEDYPKWHYFVQQEYTSALTRLPAEKVYPDMMRLLSSGTLEQREMAAEVLGKLRWAPAAMLIIKTWTQTDHPYAQWKMTDALVKIGTPEVIRFLHEQIAQKTTLAVLSTEHLCKIGSPAGLSQQVRECLSKNRHSYLYPPFADLAERLNLPPEYAGEYPQGIRILGRLWRFIDRRAGDAEARLLVWFLAWFVNLFVSVVEDVESVLSRIVKRADMLRVDAYPGLPAKNAVPGPLTRAARIFLRGFAAAAATLALALVALLAGIFSDAAEAWAWLVDLTSWARGNPLPALAVLGGLALCAYALENLRKRISP